MEGKNCDTPTTPILRLENAKKLNYILHRNTMGKNPLENPPGRPNHVLLTIYKPWEYKEDSFLNVVLY